MTNQWNDKIFDVNVAGFEKLALEIFYFQYQHNAIYKAYADMLKVKPENITNLNQIPFLPIGFFKTHRVKTTEFEPQIVFESSGTTQSVNSRHFIKDSALYRQSFVKTFELFYGSINEWCVIGLLPSYVERGNSSLVFMVTELIQQTRHPRSGFYLYEYEKLHKTLSELETTGQKTILIGVSFALLDFAEQFSLPLANTIILETGGMKGKRKEIIRQELHNFLKEKFNVNTIHSEYGMTELLSQAYSRGNGVFHCPPWMKVLIRDEEDPLQVTGQESLVNSELLSINDYRLYSERGIINIIDLANLYSCSFIATDDAGKLCADGSFEVLGRIDNSDIRGCSLMAI
jgi:hypothetical protein